MTSIELQIKALQVLVFELHKKLLRSVLSGPAPVPLQGQCEAENDHIFIGESMSDRRENLPRGYRSKFHPITRKWLGKEA